MMRPILFVWLTLSPWLLANLHAQEAQAHYQRVRIDLRSRSIAEIAALGLEADHGQYIPGRFLLNDYSDAELQLLQAAGFSCEIVIPDVQAYYQDSTRTTAAARTTGNCPPGNETESRQYYPVPANFTLGSMAGFYTYQEMLSILEQMHARFPDLISPAAPLPGGTSVEGRPIYWLKITREPTADDGNKPKVLYTSLHHAREPNSLTQLIYFMWYLLENYESDPEVNYLLNNTSLYFVPCLNPDGYLYNQVNFPQGGGLWRKNRRSNGDGSMGVDLNRNYGYAWGHDNIGSSLNPASEVYRGTEPFSEPETRALRDFCLQHQFRVALNHHTFGNLLIFPWGYSDSPTDNEETFSNLGRALTFDNQFVSGTGTETVGYVVNGGSDDWMYGQVQIYSMTAEVGTGDEGFWPAQSSIIPNSQRCMWMNLAAAHAVHNFGLAKALGDTYWTPATTTQEVTVERHGFTGGTFSVSFSPLQPSLVSVSPASLQLNLATNERVDTSFALTLSPALVSGQQLSFLLRIDNGYFVRTDTVWRSFLDVDEPAYTNSMNSAADWSSAANAWGLTSARYFSPPSSLADSPQGLYANNNYTTVTQQTPLTVGPAEKVILFFRASWDIEPYYDYAQAQLSVNGGPFIPLCGKYTHPGSMFQGVDEPVYDGNQQDWVLEEIDLSAYVATGDAIRLRFALGADAFQNGDGFFVDDLALYVLSPDSTVNVQEVDAADFSMQVRPNPAKETIQIEVDGFADACEAVVTLYNISGMALEEYSKKLFPGKNIIYFGVEGLPNGLYTIRLRTSEGQEMSVKAVVNK